MSDEEDVTPEIVFLGHDPRTGARVGFPFGTPEPIFWNWYSIISTYEIEQALGMVMGSARILRGDATEAERDYMRSWLQGIKDFGDRIGNKEDIVLKRTYQMISQGDWTRGQALRYAQNILGSDLTETAWRLRLLRYREKEGLPPLAKRGRPRKQK